tara:strand:- start:382 stop:654 length:273 start_codon:yes stop_codon:yes gene_type:complete
LLLFLIDIVATLSWFIFWNVPEGNPVLADILNRSTLLFVITKIALSFPPIYILDKYIEKTITQIGIFIVLATYISIALLHYFIFIFFLIN